MVFEVPMDQAGSFKVILYGPGDWEQGLRPQKQIITVAGTGATPRSSSTRLR
jgi:hypothetical protein